MREARRMTDVELTRAIERCEVPDEGFGHVSHLRVAWVYLHESASVDEAIDRMASTLRRFAASCGKADRYSQSTTVFWMHQIAAARAVMPDADCDRLVRAYPRLLDKTLILAYYSGDAAATRSTDSSSGPPDRSLSRESP
jgi:hypothetical protein